MTGTTDTTGGAPHSSPPPLELERLAVRAAAAAAALVAERAGGDLGAATKSSATDVVTEVDRAAEHLLVELLLGERPHDAVVGEEGTAHAGTSGVQWILDPIDGTTNFVYGHPGYAVSVAAAVADQVVAGAVADVARGEVFSAAAGSGARCDGAPISPTGVSSLELALVATGFSYDAQRRRRQAEVLTTVLPRVRDIRRMGSAAMDLCWVACGRVDAYFERGLNRWDYAAGALIAAEAGAVVGGADGPPAPGELIVAASPAISADLLDLLLDAGAQSV